MVLALVASLLVVSSPTLAAHEPPATEKVKPRKKKKANKRDKRKKNKKKSSSSTKQDDVLDGKPGIINKKGDKALDPRFDPKTLGKTKNLKKPEDVNAINITRNYGDKYPCKKFPLDTKLNVDMEEFKLDKFTKMMACFTGKRFLLSKGVTGQITIYSSGQPITLYEYYKAYLSALEANNLTVVKRGKFYRIVQKVEARTSGAEILGPNRATPETDNVITQLIPIQYVDPQMVVDLLKQFATGGADITVYEPTSTLILTEVGSNIRRLRKLI